MNSDSGRVSLNGLGFMAGTGRARLLARLAALASLAVGPHMGGGRLGRYAGYARCEGRKARLGWLVFGPCCLEN
jgi:hypothetical protein